MTFAIIIMLLWIALGYTTMRSIHRFTKLQQDLIGSHGDYKGKRVCVVDIYNNTYIKVMPMNYDQPPFIIRIDEFISYGDNVVYFKEAK